jgi:hypothetical protein
MPLTTIYGDGTRIVGDANALEQTLHPTVMAYINIMQSSTGGNYSMSLNEIDAVNNMVQALVSNGIWTKIKAIYPIIGTTAAAHKWNLKDPRDADASFRLSFLGGGWTHSANGATPNGTTSYANTFLIPNTSLTANSGHLSYYSRTNSAVANELPIGVSASLGGTQFTLVIRRTGDLNSFRSTEIAGTTGAISSTSTDGRGLTLGSITASNSRKIYKNGTLLNTNSSAITWARNTFSVFIGATNISDFVTGPNFYTDKQCAFASIGDGLSDAEAKAFSTIVQAFQTKLGRQV